MATPRSLTVDPSASGIYHCTSRCVRRAFLCGRDFHSGQDYEHRRAWIRDRTKELAEVFSVEIFSCSIMSNHLHLIVRTLPEQVAGWDDEEVARRWLRIFPGPGQSRRRDAEGRPLPPDGAAIQALCNNRKELAENRKRLASLSWFMRCLKEPIARRANKEDGCKGHFWEGRFDCEKLDDEAALLACMQYVDLNPVRAKRAESVEDSDFTSAQDRLVAHRARRQLELAPEHPTPEQASRLEQAKREATRDQWLAPLGQAATSASAPAPPPRIVANAHLSSKAANRPGSEGRPVDLPPPLLAHVSEERYLELLDWTGRQIRTGKRGQISAHLRPVLEQLDLDVEAWVDNVERFGGLFFRIAGKVRRLKELAKSLGRSWFRGHAGARLLYGRGT